MVIAGYRMMTELIKAPKATPAAPTAGSMCNSGDGDALTAGIKSKAYHNQYMVFTNDTPKAAWGIRLRSVFRSYNDTTVVELALASSPSPGDAEEEEEK
jgi:hypothetical protein